MGSDFKDSAEHARRRLCREVIKKAPVTRTQREILRYIFNLWNFHKSGPKGFMAPGREKIAKKVGCACCTVSETLRVLRKHDVLEVVGCSTGGKGNTRYRFSEEALFPFCGVRVPEEISGQLVPLYAYRADVDMMPDRAPAELEIAHDTLPKFSSGGTCEPEAVTAENRGGEAATSDGASRAKSVAVTRSEWDGQDIGRTTKNGRTADALDAVPFNGDVGPVSEALAHGVCVPSHARARFQPQEWTQTDEGWWRAVERELEERDYSPDDARSDADLIEPENAPAKGSDTEAEHTAEPALLGKDGEDARANENDGEVGRRSDPLASGPEKLPTGFNPFGEIGYGEEDGVAASSSGRNLPETEFRDIMTKLARRADAELERRAARAGRR